MAILIEFSFSLLYVEQSSEMKKVSFLPTYRFARKVNFALSQRT